MTQKMRFFIQVSCWFLIWAILWLVQEMDWFFLKDNISAFIFQSFVIGLVVWYMTPNLLLKKKYFLFAFVSLVLIIVGGYITSHIVPGNRPPRIPLNKPRNPLPTQFFIHSIIIGASLFLANLLETFVYAKKKEEENILNKNEKLTTELKFLKSQINPHFLFNSLNNIYALAVIDSDKTRQGISSLSNMLRYVLYECDRPLVSLEKEILYIENYLKLYRLKSSKKIPITTRFLLKHPKIQIVPMLLLPFAENALKHSFVEKDANGFINIELDADTEEIVFYVENSFPDQNMVQDNQGGIGIENVKRRLHLLYPDKHDLIIESLKGIFKVTLKLDLQ